jgi:hypothetical protein
MRFKSYYEGQAAYAKGKTINPYEEGTDEHEYWQDGFDHAHQADIDKEYITNVRSRNAQQFYE